MSETKRYLRTSDYKKAIFLSHLDQLTQGEEQVLIEAELDAKSCINSMLTDEYEIESEFVVGEAIKTLSTQKEYFKDDCVIVNEKTSKAKTYVGGSKPPKSEDFWRLMGGGEIDENTVFENYDQNSAYYGGDIVLYSDTNYYECLIANGTSVEDGSENIIQPNLTQYWEDVTHETWAVGTDYTTFSAITSLVEESGVEYALITPANAVVGTSPSNDVANAWQEVAVQSYDRANRYERTGGFDGYVVFGGAYYYCSEANETNVNGYLTASTSYEFVPAADPRNRNVIQIMVHLVLFQLHSVVVPDNIPTVRIRNMEAANNKLEMFSKMKADPAIPRKVFTYSVKNPIDGTVTEIEKSASKWAINDSEQTRDTWSY
jgi:hypothetical protein